MMRTRQVAVPGRPEDDKRRTHITAQGIGDRKEVAQAIYGADETRYRGEGTQDTECT